MTHGRTLVAGLVIAAAAFGAGCGSDSDGDTGSQAVAADPAADRRIADAAVLTSADLPDGWTGGATDDSDDEQTCPAIDSAKAAASARADTPDFTKREQFLDETVYVMDDETAAEEAFSAILSEETRTCLGDELRKALEAQVADEDVKLGEIVAEPLEPVDAGSDSGGIHVTVPFTVQGQDVAVTLDSTIVRVERVLAFVSAGGSGEPVDEAVLDEVTVAAADKAQDALDAG